MQNHKYISKKFERGKWVYEYPTPNGPYGGGTATPTRGPSGGPVSNTAPMPTMPNNLGKKNKVNSGNTAGKKHALTFKVNSLKKKIKSAAKSAKQKYVAAKNKLKKAVKMGYVKTSRKLKQTVAVLKRKYGKAQEREVKIDKISKNLSRASKYAGEDLPSNVSVTKNGKGKTGANKQSLKDDTLDRLPPKSVERTVIAVPDKSERAQRFKNKNDVASDRPIVTRDITVPDKTNRAQRLKNRNDAISDRPIITRDIAVPDKSERVRKQQENKQRKADEAYRPTANSPLSIPDKLEERRKREAAKKRKTESGSGYSSGSEKKNGRNKSRTLR